MKRLICLAVMFLCISGSAFAGEDQNRPVLVKEIGNFHMVTPRIMRGSQPSDKAFKYLKEYAKVKTVIDLRDEKDQIEREAEIVNGLGMEFISAPMNGGQRQSPSTINKVLSIMRDKSKQPVFVHCWAGKDRTGMIFAAYRIKYEHWSLGDSLMEMLAYGYDRGCCSAMEKSLIRWKDQLE